MFHHQSPSVNFVTQKLPTYCLTLLLCSFGTLLQAQYTETFGTADKGYLENFVNDFMGVSWTLSAWTPNSDPINNPVPGRDAVDYFKTLSSGVLEGRDLDQEVCWTSPVINVPVSGVSFTVDLGWIGYDRENISNVATDYIDVEYTTNGGINWTRVPTTYGQGLSGHTVCYRNDNGGGQNSGPSNNNNPASPALNTISVSGIAGNGTLRIRVCSANNGASPLETVSIDNVSVPLGNTGCTAPTLTTTVSNVSCNGGATGAIDLMVGGGATGPFTYLWSANAGSAITQDVSNLPTGTYTVTVTATGNNCTATTSATIGTAPAITRSVATSGSSCNGTPDGEIDLTVSGGQPPYTYAWSGGPTPTAQDQVGVTAGAYTVTITDFPGCTSTITATVSAVPAGAYSETFSLPNKGILVGSTCTGTDGSSCSVSDFVAVPWRIYGLTTLTGIQNTDYFSTTAGGKMEVADPDQTICWESPALNTTNSGALTFSVDLSWTEFDSDNSGPGTGDWIAVEYSTNGGSSFTELANAVGGGIHTINYTQGNGTNLSNSTTVTSPSITANSLIIRVCFNFNAMAERATLDNVITSQSVQRCFGPTVTFTQTDVLCNGAATGAINLTVTDGTTPYTFNWGSGINSEDRSDLVAGIYNVTVTDANSITATASVTITQPSAINIAHTQTNVLCNGATTGAINITATGGTGTLTYNWGSGIVSEDRSVLTAGTYTVTVTDANMCTASKSITITEPAALNLTTSTNSPICGGTATGMIDLTVTGGFGGYTYDWSNDGAEAPDNDPQDLSNATPGTYTVTVTDGNFCTATTSATITANNVTAGSINGTQTLCTGGDPVLLGEASAASGSGTLTYRWESNTTGCGGAFSPIPGAVGTTYDPPANATVTTYYRRVAISTQGAVVCEAPSNCVTVSVNFANASVVGSDQTLCPGGGSNPAAFTVTTPATGGGALTYQWQRSTVGCGSGFSDIPLALNPTYDEGVLAQTSYYRVVVTSTLNGQTCTATSNCITVTLGDVVPPTIVCPANQNVIANASCSGTVGTWSLVSKNDNCTASGNIIEGQDVLPSTVLTGHNATQTVVLAAVDESGNSATCAFTVTLKDQTAPSITCPANTTVAANASCQATVGTRLPTSLSDNCNPSPAITQSPAASVMLTGHNTVQTVSLTANDGNGNTASCTFTLTVKDVTPPSITCPANATVAANASCQGTVGTRVPASLSDNCNPSSTVTQSPVAGTILTGHNTAQTVTLTANDGNGNTATCVLTVTLKDVTPPTITCQSDVTINVSANCQGTLALYSLTGSDNCSPSLGYTQNPGEGTIISGHNTVQVVTLTASDEAGNTASCPVTVTLRDVTPPSITCPANATVALNASCQSTIGTFSAATLSDNCNPSPAVTQSPASSTVLTGHNSTQTVTLTANDGNGNTATCSFVVTAKDATAPSITCPANSTVALNASCQATVGAFTAVTLADNCNPTPTVTQSPVSSTLITGHNSTQTVTLTANDGNGNTNTCSFVVTGKDVTAPTIACPANSTVALNASCQTTVGTYSAASVSDNCNPTSGVTQSPASSTVISGHNSTQTVTLTANDGNGNTATCSFVVTAKDVTPPTIACPANATVAAGPACSGTVGTRTLVSKTDNCAASGSIAEAQSPAAATVLSGHNAAQTVTLTANDGNGNTATCSFTVTLKDVTPPSITCPSNIVQNAAPGLCSAVISYPAVSTTDNCSATVAQTAGLPSGSAFPVGVTTQAFQSTDAGSNTATCSFTVTIVDNQPPMVTCPANIVQDNDLNQCGATVTYVATVTDNCTVSSQSALPASGSFFAVGTTTVTLTATDSGNNTASCTFNVTVNDVQPLVVTCPPPVTRTSNAFQCGTSQVNLGTATATDNCAVGNFGNNAPSFYPVGQTVVTWTANDIYGNTATCSQVVTVVDNALPVVECPENLTVTSTTFDCSAEVNYSVVASDNCSVSFIEYSQAPGSVFSGGSNLVEVTVFDPAGNFSECSFWVFVQAAEETCDGVDNDCDGLVDEADDFVQISKQTDPTSGQFDQFANAVAIDGNTTLVGVKLDDEKGFNAGAAQVYERNANGQWVATQRLTANDAATDDQFGNAVAIKGNIALVAANLRDDNGINAGTVYVYQRTGSLWSFVTKLHASDPSSNQNFGASVDFDGRFAIVGANLDDDEAPNAGAAYIFDAQNGWAQVAKLLADDAGPNEDFGFAVAISSQTHALVGAPLHNGGSGDNFGAAYLFQRNTTTNVWAFVKKLTSTNSTPGDRLGFSVDLQEQSAIVGAPRNDYRKPNGGLAYVFERNQGGSNNWGEAAKLFAYDSEVGDQLGRSVAIDGNLAVVATPYENAKGSGAGAAYTYLREPGGSWIFVQKIVDPTGNLDDNLFWSIGLSGRTLVAGAPRDDDGNQADRGSVQWFESACGGDNPTFNDPTPGNLQVIDNHTGGNTGTGSVQAFPVPFTSELGVLVQLPADAETATLTVTNTLGQVVTTLHQGALPAGTHQLRWQPGSQLPAGTYFLRFDAGSVHEVRSVVRVQE